VDVALVEMSGSSKGLVDRHAHLESFNTLLVRYFASRSDDAAD
jgi:hypothetical protein